MPKLVEPSGWQSDQREVPFRWSIADLPPGEHTIEGIVSGRKNRAAKHHAINVGRIVAYQ